MVSQVANTGESDEVQLAEVVEVGRYKVDISLANDEFVWCAGLL